MSLLGLGTWVGLLVMCVRLAWAESLPAELRLRIGEQEAPYRRVGEAEIRLPRGLLLCLSLRYTNPSELARLPFQAQQWAQELQAQGRLDLVCDEQTWRVVLE